jgi:hypothetical protein
MHERLLYVMLSLVLASPTVVLAQQSGEGGGRYATRDVSAETVELPDGRSVQTTHYSQATFADDPSNPLDNHLGDCVGQFILSADGTPSAASGSCYSRDGDGDGVSYWWRMDESGTASCPDVCGSFGVFAGYGKYEGLTGTGTWQRTTVFPDGGTGTWDLIAGLPVPLP